MTDEWMRYVYDTLAIPGSVLAMYVMVKADADRRRNRTDPLWLRDLRKIAFFVAASFMLLSVAYTDWIVSFPVIMLIAANDCLLTINAISLFLRKEPPRNGMQIPVFGQRNPAYARFSALIALWRKEHR